MSLLAHYQHETWPSPAKLNLFLHITGQRADGYHELQSLFQMLDHGDSLQFSPNAVDEIQLLTPFKDVLSCDNLIVKAAQALSKKATEDGRGNLCGVAINIDKTLPMGGGLGGGSTNAATTLVVLNYLWECHYSLAELAQLGLSLGADVPVFINGKTTFAEGVGEHFFPVPNSAESEQYYLVVHPNEHISTKTIFTHENLPRNTAKIDFTHYNFANTRNDCQELVVNLYPKVAYLLQHLLHYAPSRMTGTGACIFAVFDKEETALEVLELLKHRQILDNNTTAFIAQGVAESPLLTKIKTIFDVRDKD